LVDVFDAVRTILAVRSYQDRPVPEDVLRRIVEAGRLTGSSMNGQPWHFIVVQDAETLRTLGSLARSGGYTANATAAIVVAIDPTRFAVSDASRAIQSMTLTAWSEGVASSWVGFGGLESVKPVLGIPDNLDVFAIVPLGYPENNVGQGRKKRKPLGEVAHRERFGTPLE
jgi:nitroreductase